MDSTNPLAALEALYLEGDWERAFRRVGNPARASLDLIRIALVLAADLRRVREVLEMERKRP
jgi:hypothetical protein